MTPAAARKILMPDINAVAAAFWERYPRETEPVKVWVDPKADEGGRHLAYTTGEGDAIHLAPRLATFPRCIRRAILAHEYGHSVDIAHGGPQGDSSAHAPEIRADEIAEDVMGRSIVYAAPLWLQSFGKPRVFYHPRPAFLDAPPRRMR